MIVGHLPNLDLLSSFLKSGDKIGSGMLIEGGK